MTGGSEGEPDQARPDLVGRLGAGGGLVAGIALAAITLAVDLPRDLASYGFSSATIDRVQFGSAALSVLAGALALRRPWRATAAVLMALSATALGLLGAAQYGPRSTALLTTLVGLPSVMTWLAWREGRTTGAVARLGGLTAALLATVAVASWATYTHYLGPTHPTSAAGELDLGQGDWVWLGGVTTDRAVIVAGGLDPGRPATLWYRPTGVRGGDGRGEAPTIEVPTGEVPAIEVPAIEVVADADGLARFELEGLAAGTRYHYGTGRPPADTTTPASTGTTFRTFDAGPQDVVVALGSCARVGSNGAVFDAIVGHQPDLFVALGDLHYANLESTDPADHIAHYGRAAGQPGQAALFSSTPIAYVWDDHDSGPNNSDSRSPTRPAVGEAYRRAIPHYGVDPDPLAPIAQAFTIGRVRFVVSDGRSQRDDRTMLGPRQLTWLIDELVAASASHALVVWANPSPWIGEPDPGSDSWARYPEERSTIAQALADAGVDNLVMISGDAHMVAIDDGTNTAYHDGPEPGFPLLHAAALDRIGTVKGGPYSEGASPGGGQYGLVEVDDDGGSTIEVSLSGHRWDGTELVSHRFEVEVDPAG